MISAKGRAELIKHRSGKKLSYKQAVLAKCNECCGFYADGKLDCQIPDCPLYGFMPYRTTNKKIKSKALAIAINGVSGDE
jgi:hypothetical protein